ncbi:MAG: hypothetical protein BWY95_01642 [Bacteroidetes bacterium ADurb.BinA104]|nr:MAG: hypothetical protein BWY95_01642 [Bacteroidetes bacterium ADurb.BinA104]
MTDERFISINKNTAICILLLVFSDLPDNGRVLLHQVFYFLLYFLDTFGELLHLFIDIRTFQLFQLHDVTDTLFGQGSDLFVNIIDYGLFLCRGHLRLCDFRYTLFVITGQQKI